MGRNRISMGMKDQIEVALKGSHQSISARCRELVLAGRIKDSGIKRKTRSGRNAVVYIPVLT